MEPTPSKFEGTTFDDKQLLYQGLLSLVTSNSGYGFANNDQGHLAYAVGRSGNFDYETLGDSPDRNRLFQMMHALSIELNVADIDGTSEVGDYVFSWADFCNLAYAAYEKAKGT